MVKGSRCGMGMAPIHRPRAAFLVARCGIEVWCLFHLFPRRHASDLSHATVFLFGLNGADS